MAESLGSSAIARFWVSMALGNWLSASRAVASVSTRGARFGIRVLAFSATATAPGLFCFTISHARLLSAKAWSGDSSSTAR